MTFAAPVYLLLALWGLVLAINVHRPVRTMPRTSIASFFAGWLSGELAHFQVLLHVLVALLGLVLGVFRSPLGIAAGSCSAISVVLLLVHIRQAHAAGVTFGRALAPITRESSTDHHPPAPAGWGQALRPWYFRRPGVERIRDVRYRRVAGLNLKLDVFRPEAGVKDAPALVMIHGGGWMIGSKNEQNLPLGYLLAERGWVCFNVDYRLSPHATFPDHLIDLKWALHWVRTEGRKFGVAGDFVAVSGNSAGAHLASLLALTPNDHAYQPGFEDGDTSVQAAVCAYGVYDLTNRHDHWPHTGLHGLVERQVMKGTAEEIPEKYWEASPLDRISPSAPPFLVVHGESDTLVPVEEGRRFIERLRKHSRQAVAWAELAGAQHAFDLFPSLRTNQFAAGSAEFLQWALARHRASAPGAASDSARGPAAGQAAERYFTAS